MVCSLEQHTTKIEGVRNRKVKESNGSFLSPINNSLNSINIREITFQKIDENSISDESKFQATINFVRSYLNNIVQQKSPFADKEQNKLTFEASFK